MEQSKIIDTLETYQIAKLAIHQDRTTSRTRERERERDQTHSYWYIPSTPRVNYSLLVMESTGMMKMATDDGFPLRQNGLPRGFWWLQRLAAAELQIYLDLRWF